MAGGMGEANRNPQVFVAVVIWYMVVCLLPRATASVWFTFPWTLGLFAHDFAAFVALSNFELFLLHYKAQTTSR